MSIIYNGQTVAGVYTEQILNNADTINAGIIKIATQEEVNAGENNTSAVTPLYLAQKQDKISAGDNIVINNNEISCTIKPDEQTIVRKNNGTMQCIGQLTKSNTLKFDWEGTQAEYNVAYLNGTIQPDWYCYITDDEEIVDYGDIANQSLSNLRPEGEARFTAKANTDLSNLTEEGADKLNTSKMYLTGSVSEDEQGFEQLKQMKHSTFDKSKFTVVGSPNITDDGIASGFSRSNYLRNNINITPATNLVIKNKFTIGTLTSAQMVYAFNNNNIPRISVESATEIRLAGIGVSLKVIVPTLTQGQIIETKVILYSNNIKLEVYINGQLYSNNRDESVTFTNLKFVTLGALSNGVYPFKGSIDLKQFSITVDGKEVFSGNKTGIDNIKADDYEVVGSPVISDDGVASGFSSGNYIKSTYIPPLNFNSLEIISKFTVGALFSANRAVYGQSSVNMHTPQLNYDVSAGMLMFLISSDGTSWTNGAHMPIMANTTYWCRLLWENNLLYYSYSLNGKNWTLLKSEECSTITWDEVMDIGADQGSSSWNGSIDLNAFKIYVDGNLVYQPCLKIPYTQSKTGSKIVDVAYRDRVIDLYEQEGQAGYYTIDEPNKNFTLPMGEIYGMIGNIKNTKSGGSGLEVGDIGMALYVDETKGLRRYLNGQIVDINANTQAFLNRLLEIKNTNPDYFTTEENWQAEATLNIDGCVYKFVLNYSGETVVSVRLPKYPDYVEINAGGTLPVVGNGMTLGWTDGTVNLGSATGSNGNYHFQFLRGSYGAGVGSAPGTGAPSGAKNVGITSDPTKSGIQTTLKQTKLKMRYFIQIATGSETEANIVNTLENVNGFTLLESKYSDKPLYNESWLLSNGQYNAKAVYPTAYEGLQVEYNTEIEAGTTVTLPSGVSYTKRGLSVKLSTETYTDYDFVLNTANEKFRLPLKTKQKFYDDTAPVVGNGMTLGLDTGHGLVGLGIAESNIDLVAVPTSYGTQIGSSLGTGSTGRYNVGVTADPTKSGLETHLTETTLYLYFYVGDIDQNHGIVNMGRIGEQLANKTDMLQASGAGMPSSRYIDLTLGASGSTYTAPANGWFRLVKLTTAVGQSIHFNPQELYRGRDISDAWMYQFSSIANQALTITLPVLKGQKTWCYYSAGGDTVVFEFIYAEGSK